ncbi:electron transport complex subunit RsxC [Collinsella sp. AGMB00827]|uniref:Ion-translocating oxidoreductase complex subunit C n=1 Tax=Collinsella ureilytica TaxID=2869515 RepID=A0ABS7MJL0_9ACTN|nr:electron transport complex subunit RsxC [Collinsella urealyticum]MBY4797271.1 electron transport complex subunit RsxC [Collinsella urealyticum]
MFTLHTTRGGVHPPQYKDMRDHACRFIEQPKRVRIPMNMHIGAPCKPVVAPQDHVYVGTLIGDGEGLYAPVHASVSGTVEAVVEEVLPTGVSSYVVEIASDGKHEADPHLEIPTYTTQDEFIDCVRASGIVGLGGAAFPTWFKMQAPKGKRFEAVVINGMECEPYITSDFRQMMEHGDLVIAGAARIARALSIPEVAIGIEDNKPEAIQHLQKIVVEQGLSELIEVLSIPTKYPAGGEKVLIHATTGRDVPAGGLPVDVGCLVMNVTTVARVEYFFQTGRPLVYKVMTIAGDCVKNPGNYLVPLGMSVHEIIDGVGGFDREPRKIIMGGPMMGRTIDDIECPVIKANNAILFFHDQAILPDETPCIRCGRCVLACPLGLMPFALDGAARRSDTAALDEFAVMNCMECGSCVFSCPAHRRIVASIREGKDWLRSETARLTKPKEA